MSSECEKCKRHVSDYFISDGICSDCRLGRKVDLRVDNYKHKCSCESCTEKRSNKEKKV